MSLQDQMCFRVSRVAVVSKSFEGQTDRAEEWYGTQYKQEAISNETIQVTFDAPKSCSFIVRLCFRGADETVLLF